MSQSGSLEITPAGEDDGQAGAIHQVHARLEWQAGALSVTDLGGHQRLAVNGAPLEVKRPTLLHAADTLEIAGLRFIWRPGEIGLDVAQIREGEPAGPSRYFLTLTTPEWSRELPLLEPLVSLGRAEENDFIINHSGISRFHARLEQIEGAYELIDLGSTFGLKFQEQHLTRKVLADGDQIQIAADVSLTFRIVGPRPAAGAQKQAEPLPLSAGGQTSVVDMARHLEDGPRPLPEATGLWQTAVPHLVVHTGDQTWQALFAKDHMSIGRDDDNDIIIPDSSVSGRHATIERRGEEFIIRDAGSDNGLWLGKQRLEAHKLRPGDIVNVGRARIVFKSGFSPNDLTLIGTPTIDGQRRRRPVVFVPGLGGSELWLGSERIYPIPKILLSNPEILSLPGDPRIEARHIVSDVVILPGVFKQEQYSRLGDYLVSGLGYRRGDDLIEFAYDWRQDIRLAARKLGEMIEQWRPGAPITIIGHSLGTLVTRYYIEKLGGKRLAERIILMGGPHYGTPKAILAILTGPGILPFGLANDRIRQVMSQYPTSYQILPIYPCVFDQEGRQIDVLRDESWLPENQRPFLKAARDFHSELGLHSSVPTVSIFGYGYKTAVRTLIERRPGGGWHKVSFVEEVAGDLTVPSGSAVLKNSEIHPVYQEHGALYVDNDVKMRLKVELTRSTTIQGKSI